MRSSPRIAVAGAAALAAFTVGAWTLAGPAVADEVPVPVVTSGTTAGSTPVQDLPVIETDDVQAQASKSYTPGTEEGPDGKWLAYIEVGGGFVRFEVGTYDTRREARKAARAAAREANGVVAGPGCDGDDPLVLC
jgi:hypothetical protein